MKTSELVAQRGKEYGSYAECALRAQYFRDIFKTFRIPFTDGDKQKRAVWRLTSEMWSVKLARLAFKRDPDTIADLGGYSLLLIRELGQLAFCLPIEFEKIQNDETLKYKREFAELIDIFRIQIQEFENKELV